MPSGSTVFESTETHPAYAQISGSRVSGGAVLYGSDFKHQHYVTIRIAKSDLHRGLSNDRLSTREHYIEVALSEAQWATFVSSLNIGSGVQCTLQWFQGKHISQIPAPPDRTKQFALEASERLKMAADGLQRLRETINLSTANVTTKRNLLSAVELVARNLTPNLMFVADQFAEHMERTTERAKIEVNAYVQNVIQRAGIKRLQESGDEPIVLELTSGKED